MLPAYLSNAAARTPDAPAVMTLDADPVSYGELDRRARSLARALGRDFGIVAGDRVTLAMGNDPAYLEVLFGCWYAGVCVAPMNPRLHPREFAQLAQDCAAKLCFATPDIAPGLAPVFASDMPVCTVPGPMYARLTGEADAPGPVAVAADDPVWLFYTSGTTGKPKGATLTHRNLDAMAQSFLADSGAATDEALLHIAPMSHAGGLIGLSYIDRGLPHVYPPFGAALTPDILAACLRRAGRASVFAVPTLVNRFRNPDFLPRDLHGHLGKILFGGAPMYATDLQAAIDWFGAGHLWGGYGQGEAPCTITHIPSEMLADRTRPDYAELLGSVGVARTGVEVRIVDEQDAPVPVGQVGEVNVRGDVVMAGYWNMPEATAATLRGGWLHTGDLGRLGESGLLTLVDRSKDMIICGGSNVYPREIEEVLLTHPQIVEAAVVGSPDPEWGELPVAFVVPDPATGDATPDAESLDRFCLDHMARYKRPRQYRFVDHLPTSSYGKILKSELRAMLANTKTPR